MNIAGCEPVEMQERERVYCFVAQQTWPLLVGNLQCPSC